MHRLVRDDTHRTPVDPGERGDDRLALLRGDVEHIAVVEDPQQDLVHVVGGVVIVRNDGVEFEVVRRDLRLETGIDDRRIAECVGGQETQVVADVLERRLLVLHDLVDIAVLGLRVGAAELVEADVLARDVLDHIRSGDEHVALVADRHDKIGLNR